MLVQILSVVMIVTGVLWAYGRITSRDGAKTFKPYLLSRQEQFVRGIVRMLPAILICLGILGVSLGIIGKS